MFDLSSQTKASPNIGIRFRPYPPRAKALSDSPLSESALGGLLDRSGHPFTGARSLSQVEGRIPGDPWRGHRIRPRPRQGVTLSSLSGECDTLAGSVWKGNICSATRKESRGRGGSWHIGHHFADDRCLWSEHPSGDLCITPHLRRHFRDSGLVMCVSTFPSPSLSVPCICGILQSPLPKKHRFFGERPFCKGLFGCITDEPRLVYD